jgi:hypothetical protein
MFQCRQDNQKELDGLTTDNPIVLPQVKDSSSSTNSYASPTEGLSLPSNDDINLTIYMDGRWRPPPYRNETLIGLLELSRLYQSQSIRSFAVHHINDVFHAIQPF